MPLSKSVRREDDWQILPGKEDMSEYQRPQQKCAIATCIGCACTDMQACVADGEPCYWLRLDRDAGRGVCSACPGHVEAWDKGDRS